VDDYQGTLFNGIWKVKQIESKYAACKVSNEHMRISSNGDFSLGAEEQILEQYDFDTYRFAWMFCRYAQEIEDGPAYSSFALSNSSDLGIGTLKFNSRPEQSNYQCHWADITYVPTKAKLPNRFARKMTEIFFGCKWSKIK
jgi:hypothetical protein